MFYIPFCPNDSVGRGILLISVSAFVEKGKREVPDVYRAAVVGPATYTLLEVTCSLA